MNHSLCFTYFYVCDYVCDDNSVHILFRLYRVMTGSSCCLVVFHGCRPLLAPTSWQVGLVAYLRKECEELTVEHSSITCNMTGGLIGCLQCGLGCGM